MSAYLGRHPASKGCYLVEILPILGYVIVPLMMMMMMMMMFYVLRHMEDERIVTALTVLMNINFPMPGIHVFLTRSFIPLALSVITSRDGIFALSGTH